MGQAGYRTLAGGLLLADNISAALQRGRAVNAQRRAERDHFGTVAQLASALKAIKDIAPSHPLNSQKVRDHIDGTGQWVGSFAAAWRLNSDPEAIHSELSKVHELARQKVLAQIEKTAISHRESGWFSSECFIFLGVKFDTQEAAQTAKTEALRLARCASIDDSLDPLQIVKKVLETSRKLMEPVVVDAPRGERPPARAFRRRKM